MLTVAEMPIAPEIGRALYAESKKPENFNDRWLSRALYIAATRHRDTFLTQYKSDRERRRRSPRCRSRCGSATPSLTGARRPRPTSKSDWKDMQVPGAWETRGLPDFDGVVWFSRAVDVPAGSGADRAVARSRQQQRGSLGQRPVGHARAGAGRGAAPPAGGRGGGPPVYQLPAGAMHPGANTITVRIQNNRNDGGFLGTARAMFLDTGTARAPLAGTWRYRVERQTNAGDALRQAGRARGARRLHRRRRRWPVRPVRRCRRSPRQAPDVVLRLAVVPGQMRFDTSELTVAPDQTVEIVFVNPDGMQHNFVLGAQGSLDTLGAAADVVARSPNGLAQQYVPDSPAVLFSTKLLEPGQTVSFQFKAPAEAGKYPYVCTFPAHWKTMNGTLNVVAPAGRGRGGQ